ncbi:hypothetical protein V8B97DRAFT_1919402 [Scleroderma yunnanense]
MASKTITPILTTENIVILEVDNLLSGWPTYIVNFTPKKTSPLKLLLQLKDSVPYQQDKEDEEDSDEEDNKKAIEMKKCPAIPAVEASLMATIEMDAVEYSTLSIIPLQANTIAIVLHSVFKDNSQAICKHKAKEVFCFPDDIHWPPYSSHTFCSIPNNSSIATLSTIRTLAASIHMTTSVLMDNDILKKGPATKKETSVTQEDEDNNNNNNNKSNKEDIRDNVKDVNEEHMDGDDNDEGKEHEDKGDDAKHADV